MLGRGRGGSGCLGVLHLKEKRKRGALIGGVGVEVDAGVGCVGGVKCH